MNSDDKGTVSIWNRISTAVSDGYNFIHTNSFLEEGEVWFTCALIRGYNNNMPREEIESAIRDIMS